MTQFIYALLTASLWLPVSFAQEIPRKESFSLKPILDEMGYLPLTSRGTPISSENDLINSVEWKKNQRPFVESQEYPGPFRAMAASPNLATVALGFDGSAFPSSKYAKSTVVVVGLPDWLGLPLRPLRKYILDHDTPVNGVSFLSEQLLRVETKRVPERDPLRMGSTFEYTIYDITGDGKTYNLREDLGLKNVIYVRQFSEKIYVVAHDPYGTLDSQKIVFSVIKHDPLTRISRSLLNFNGDPNLGYELLHGPVNEPGRDVWRYGEDQLRIFVQHYDRLGSVWRRMVLDVNGNYAQLKHDFGSARFDDLEPIENTDEYYKRGSDSALMIYQEDDSGTRNLVYRDTEVSPYQRLRMVSIGFIGEEDVLNMHRTFLYKGNGRRYLLTSNRLIHSAHRDGGFMGVTSVDQTDGTVNLIRVIYDRDHLVKAELQGSEASRDCANLLLGRIQKKIRDRRR